MIYYFFKKITLYTHPFLDVLITTEGYIRLADFDLSKPSVNAPTITPYNSHQYVRTLRKAKSLFKIGKRSEKHVVFNSMQGSASVRTNSFVGTEVPF